MRKSIEKLTRKLFSIGKRHINIIDHFIEDGRHTSESDVVRQALMFYHDKIYPSYVFHLSPAAKMKQKEIEEIEEIENQTDDEFAASFKFYPIESNSGEKFYFYRGLGRVPSIIPAASIREWVEIPKNKFEIEENLQNYERESTEEYFSGVVGKAFCERNDLKIPEYTEISG